MWKVNWFWQIRQLSAGRFLVRFPPSKRIKELVEYPAINLKKKGVNVSFLNWEGEAKPYEVFKEVWVNIEGIPCQWLTWKVMARVASALGVMVNVDWHVIFKSFYRKIRLLIAVRDTEKIPPNKLFEMEQCFFLVTFDVEKPTVDGITIDEDDDNNGDDDQQEGNEHAAEEHEDEGELGDDGGAGGVTGMDTKMITPKAKSGSNGNAKKVSGASLGKEPVAHKEQELEQSMGQKTQLSLEVTGFSKEREAHVMSRLLESWCINQCLLCLSKRVLRKMWGHTCFRGLMKNLRRMSNLAIHRPFLRFL
jgi:hypothetical protein